MSGSEHIRWNGSDDAKADGFCAASIFFRFDRETMSGLARNLSIYTYEKSHRVGAIISQYSFAARAYYIIVVLYECTQVLMGSFTCGALLWVRARARSRIINSGFDELPVGKINGAIKNERARKKTSRAKKYTNPRARASRRSGFA